MVLLINELLLPIPNDWLKLASSWICFYIGQLYNQLFKKIIEGVELLFEKVVDGIVHCCRSGHRLKLLQLLKGV